MELGGSFWTINVRIAELSHQSKNVTFAEHLLYGYVYLQTL